MGGVDQIYERGEEIGRGGMGIVYRARHRHLDRVVALKLLIADDADGADTLQRFRQEAAAVKGLVHRNVVRLYDYDLDDDPPYLVFEYVEGGRTLFEVIDEGVLGGNGVERFGLGLCAGLAHIHEHGVVHRDLKPTNVLIDPQGVPRIIDLGLARLTSETRTRLTAAGEVMGTLAYMAPEQLVGNDATPAADVYSMGLILYELLARRLVFSARSAEDGFIAYPTRLAGRIPPIEERAPAVSPPLARLLPQLLHVDPGMRPRDGAEALSELARALGRGDDSEVGRRPAAPPRPRAKTIPMTSPEDPPGAKSAATAAPAPAPPASAVSPRVAGTAALAGVLMGVAVAAAIVVLGRPSVRATSAPVATPATPGPRAVETSPAARRAGRVRALADRLAQHRGVLDEAWLVAFAGRHKNELLRKRSRAVGVALREHLERLGIPAVAAAFLAEAPAYFQDPSVPASQRWLLRSALCDLELIEYFCAEHGIEWPLPKVGGCAGAWDRPFPELRLDLMHARSWVRGVGPGERFFPGRALTDRFPLATCRPGQHALVWYSLLRWRPGVILDITLEGGYRRLMRHTHPLGGQKALKVRAEEFIGPTITYGLSPGLEITGAVLDADERSYAGVQVPCEGIADRPWVRTRMIDLPYTPVKNDDPAVVDRILTVIDRVE